MDRPAERQSELNKWLVFLLLRRGVRIVNSTVYAMQTSRANDITYQAYVIKSSVFQHRGFLLPILGYINLEEIVCNSGRLWYTVQQKAKMSTRRAQSEIKS